jgi:hypothetical protein
MNALLELEGRVGWNLDQPFANVHQIETPLDLLMHAAQLCITVLVLPLQLHQIF